MTEFPHQINPQDIVFVHDVDKDRGTLSNSKPQTP